MVVSDLNEGVNSFRSLAENIPGIVYRVLIEEDNRTIFFNDMVQTMTGYSPEDLKKGKVCSIDPLILPEDRLKVINIVKDAIENNVPFEVEYRINNKSGELKWFFDRGRPIRGDNGKPSYIDGVIFDITKRKRMELILLESKNRYQFISENVNDMISILNEKMRYEYVNEQAFFNIMGRKKEALIGKSAVSWVHPEDVKKCRDVFKMGFETGKAKVEARFKDENGDYHWFEIKGKTFIDIDGKKKGLTISRDITKHKQLEKDLRKIAHQWRTTFDAMSESVFLLDIERNILQCNKATLDILGKERYEEIIGHSCCEIIHSTNEPVEWCPIVRMIESCHKESSISQIGDKWCEISVDPVINDVGTLIGAVHIIKDITERKKAELKFKESEERYRKQNVFLNNILKSLTHPFYVINVKDYTVALANSTASSEGLEQGKYCYSLTHNNNKPCEAPCICPLNEVKNTKRACVVEHMHYDEDGNEKIYEIYGYPILDENGNVVQMIEYALNITAHKIAQQELKESEEKYRHIVESIPIGMHMYQLDANNNLVFTGANPSADKILGVNNNQFIGKTIEEAFPPLTNTEIPEKYRQVAKEGNNWSTESITYEDELIQGAYEVTAFQISPTKMVSSFYDITDRKKTEQRLKMSEEKYRDLFESSPISLWEEDFSELKNYIEILKNSGIKDFRAYFDKNPEEVKKCVSMIKIVDINKKTLELYKANKKEDFFAGLDKVFTEESLDTFKEQIIKLAGGKTRFESESINCTFNGEKLFIFIVCEIVAGFKKDWSKILVSIVDISERKKAEQKLIESEEKFRTIAERTLMGILIIQDNQIKYINDALLNMFEYSQNEIADWERDDLTKLIHSEDLLFFREYHEHLRSGDKSFKPYNSYRVLTKSGKMKWIDQFSKEILYRGRSAELVTIIDITEKKEVEHELIKLNNIKSELLRRTSHELRTPLVSIKGFSDLLLELHRDKLDDYMIKTINQIRGGCSRLESIVNDILKTAELESGTVQLEKSKGDLSLLIKLCVSELEGLSELRNHTINLDIPDKLICTFEKEQIYNVITNILSNAIKFTPPSGKIEVKSEINNDFIIISIKDNGIGFTEEERSLIFKQFGKIERYGQGYDVISEGSGLGLYISKKIVELHGGEIWLESEGRNKGSTFIVSLPMDGN